MYILRFFTHELNKELFLKEYIYNNLPYIPRQKDLIILDSKSYDQYIVRKVSIIYDKTSKKQIFEIMLDLDDYDKEWWE